MTESFYIPLLLLAVVLFLTGMDQPQRSSGQWGLIFLSSLVVGCSILVRSVGIIMPAAMLLAIWFDRPLTPRRKLFLSAGVVALSFLVVLPLCIHNKRKYGHFNVSSSLKFNYAALVVGPTKKIVDGNDGPKLLSMWKDDVGVDYERLQPFDLADIAARAATRWAFAHPAITLEGVAKGQLTMLFAPDRSSWAPGVSFLHPSPRVFHAFAVGVAIFRLCLCLLAFYALFRWRSLLRAGWLPLFFLFVIVTHVIGVGAAGEGRYIAPVSPFIDLLAALGLCAIAGYRSRSKRLA